MLAFQSSTTKRPRPARPEPNKCIALLDMDCFFVAVERDLHPELRNVPVGVAQYKDGSGFIAISYEARALGVKRGMLAHEAQRLFPSLRVAKVETKNGKADLTKYREASDRVIAVACRFCPHVEKASVDEFYLDLSNCEQWLTEEEEEEGGEDEALRDTLVCTKYDTTVAYCAAKDDEGDADDDNDGRMDSKLLRRACQLVWRVRMAIREELGFDCSAGIAHNKFLAKSVAGMRKPFAQVALPWCHVPALCASLPVRKARSLGGKRGEMLIEQFDLSVLGDLESKVGAAKLCEIFGTKEGNRLLRLSRGEDDTAVTRTTVPKSMGASKMFRGRAVLRTRKDVSFWMGQLAREIVERLDADGRRPGTISVGSYALGSRSTSTFTVPLTVASLSAIADSLLDRLLEGFCEANGELHIESLGINLYGFPVEEEVVDDAAVAMRGKKWACKLCTLENDGEWLRCEACGSDKLGSAGDVATSSSLSSSGGERPAASSSSLMTTTTTTTTTTRAGWECGTCTYVGNDVRFLRCEMCGAGKQR